MLTDKQIKEFKSKDYPPEVITEASDFLKKHNCNCLYLTYLGENDWRLMYKETATNKANCYLFRGDAPQPSIRNIK